MKGRLFAAADRYHADPKVYAKLLNDFLTWIRSRQHSSSRSVETEGNKRCHVSTTAAELSTLAALSNHYELSQLQRVPDEAQQQSDEMAAGHLQSGVGPSQLVWRVAEPVASCGGCFANVDKPTLLQ